jgi:hypothetical protein
MLEDGVRPIGRGHRCLFVHRAIFVQRTIAAEPLGSSWPPSADIVQAAFNGCLLVQSGRERLTRCWC